MTPTRVVHHVSVETPIAVGWTATATLGAVVGIASASALSKRRALREIDKQLLMVARSRLFLGDCYFLR